MSGVWLGKDLRISWMVGSLGPSERTLLCSSDRVFSGMFKLEKVVWSGSRSG